jgi:hypothetical protein
MKKRRFDAVCGAEFGRRSGRQAGSVVVGGGFGGFGGVPPGLLEAMAGDAFDVVEVGPDQFELVAKGPGEAVRPAA